MSKLDFREMALKTKGQNWTLRFYEILQKNAERVQNLQVLTKIIFQNNV